MFYPLTNPVEATVRSETTPNGVVHIGGYIRRDKQGLGILNARTFKKRAWADKWAEKAAIAARKQDVESFAKMIQSAANSPSV